MIERILDEGGHLWSHDLGTCPAEDTCDYADDDMYCTLPAGHERAEAPKHRVRHLGYSREPG
jgi:hypothetical protein